MVLSQEMQVVFYDCSTPAGVLVPTVTHLAGHERAELLLPVEHARCRRVGGMLDKARNDDLVE
jgi:hypothetical protein